MLCDTNVNGVIFDCNVAASARGISPSIPRRFVDSFCVCVFFFLAELQTDEFMEHLRNVFYDTSEARAENPP